MSFFYADSLTSTPLCLGNGARSDVCYWYSLIGSRI